MTTRSAPTLVTLEQLESDPRYRECELWDGIPVVKEAAGGYAPYLSHRIAALLDAHLAGERRGWTGSSEVGYVLRRHPDRLLSPDIGYVSRAKLSAPPRTGFPSVVPDFVVEVRSPTQSWLEALEKGFIWSSHGVAVVWVVDCLEPRFVELRPDLGPVESGPGGVASADPALPGFRVSLDEVYRDLP